MMAVGFKLVLAASAAAAAKTGCQESMRRDGRREECVGRENKIDAKIRGYTRKELEKELRIVGLLDGIRFMGRKKGRAIKDARREGGRE